MCIWTPVILTIGEYLLPALLIPSYCLPTAHTAKQELHMKSFEESQAPETASSAMGNGMIKLKGRWPGCDCKCQKSWHVGKMRPGGRE